MAKQLTCADLCVISRRMHSCSVADIFLRPKEKKKLKTDVNTTNEQHQNLLHSIYCDAVGEVTLARLNTQNGLNHVCDSDKFYLCKDFCRSVAAWLAKKERIVPRN